MHLIQLGRSLQWASAARSSCRKALAFSPVSFVERLGQLSLVEGRRYASVKSQGAYKVKPKRTTPKKLGAKRTGDQYVIPGNIIYKQRGTVWHPGENVHMGRDHTLHASVAGYVKYYRDPRRHPDRQYIGVTFTRDDTLPYPPGAPRKRKLGLVAVPRRPVPPEAPLLGPSGIPRYVVRHENELVTVTGDETTETMTTTTTDTTPGLTMRRLGKKRDRQKNVLVARTLAHAARSAARRNTRVFRLQADYSYRETNWEIGRLVGPVGRVGGTNPVGSRRARLRARRRRRIARFKAGRAQALVRARSKRAYDKIEAEQKALKAAEEAAYAAKQKAKREAREKADREKVEAAKAQAQAQAQAQAKGTDDKTDDKKDGEETKDA